MQKTIFVCDHCKKEIGGLLNYTNLEIKEFVKITKVDLCSECFKELGCIISQYVNKANYT